MWSVILWKLIYWKGRMTETSFCWIAPQVAAVAKVGLCQSCLPGIPSQSLIQANFLDKVLSRFQGKYPTHSEWKCKVTGMGAKLALSSHFKGRRESLLFRRNEQIGIWWNCWGSEVTSWGNRLPGKGIWFKLSMKRGVTILLNRLNLLKFWDS